MQMIVAVVSFWLWLRAASKWAEMVVGKNGQGLTVTWPMGIWAPGR